MKIVNQIIIDPACEFITVDKFLQKGEEKFELINSVSFYRSELCEAFEEYG